LSVGDLGYEQDPPVAGGVKADHSDVKHPFY